jgi:hypothetical protein
MSKEALAKALIRQAEERQEILYYLGRWSIYGDLMSYAQYAAICRAKYNGHIINAYEDTFECICEMNPHQLGEVYKDLKKAGLLKEPKFLGKSFQVNGNG